LSARDPSSSIKTENLREKVRIQINLFYGNHFISVKSALYMFFRKEDKKNAKNIANYFGSNEIFTFGLFK
jgi:hypothetical protein